MAAFYNCLEEIEELVSQFSEQTLPIEKWTHEGHLTAALWHIYKYPLEEATCYLRSRIIIYNHSTKNENTGAKGYHETITLFWIKTIDLYLQDFKSQSLLEACNNFLQSSFAIRSYPLQFYSKELLFSLKQLERFGLSRICRMGFLLYIFLS